MCVGFKVTQTAEWDGNSLGPEGHWVSYMDTVLDYSMKALDRPTFLKILKRYQVSNVDVSFVNRNGGACVHMCVHICMCVSTFVSWCVFTFAQTWRNLKWMFHILFTRSPPHILKQGLSVELRVHRSSSLAGQFCPRHLRPLLRNDR